MKTFIYYWPFFERRPWEEKIMNGAGHCFGRLVIGVAAWVILISSARNYQALSSSQLSLQAQNEYVEDDGVTNHPIILNNSASHGLKVLIAQYAAGAKYRNLLSLTQPINQLYAASWGYDYTAQLESPEGLARAATKAKKTVSNSKSTYFKVLLLDEIVKSDKYDRLVLMDADAVVSDFQVDVVSLLPAEFVVAAHQVRVNDPSNINVGVTVWNLRHSSASYLVQRWKRACFDRMERGLKDDDQMPLQQVLKQERTNGNLLVHPLTHEFAYGHGTVVKHFIRPNKKAWSAAVEDGRIQKIKHATAVVCSRYNLNCTAIASS
jgi:hypothetical protein